MTTDNGVDLEVEVFEDSGQSTSLTFIVQTKATDDAEKHQFVYISLDRLRYLAGHDAPSMVARYCEPKKSLHFKWVSNIAPGLRGRKMQSLTVGFESSNEWKQNTPQHIHQTLKLYRRLKSSSETAPIGRTLKADDVSSEERFALNSTIAQVCDAVAVVRLASDVETCIPVTINRQPNVLRTEIDVLTSVTDHLDESAAADVIPKVLFLSPSS